MLWALLVPCLPVTFCLRPPASYYEKVLALGAFPRWRSILVATVYQGVAPVALRTWVVPGATITCAISTLMERKEEASRDMMLRSFRPFVPLGSLSLVGSWAWPREQHSIHESACIHLTPFNGAIRHSTSKRFVIGHPVSMISSHLFHLLLMGDKGLRELPMMLYHCGMKPHKCLILLL